MRKMFRMKYESCHGECYAHSDVMKIHTLGLDEQGAAAFLRRLLQMHAPACGDAQLGFRLDVDDDLNVFVASFERYGALDLFADTTAKGALDKLIDAALAYYETDEFKQHRAKTDNFLLAYGGRARVCRHGEDDKLVDFALAYSGLDMSAQARVRAHLQLA